MCLTCLLFVRGLLKIKNFRFLVALLAPATFADCVDDVVTAQADMEAIVVSQGVPVIIDAEVASPETRKARSTR